LLKKVDTWVPVEDAVLTEEETQVDKMKKRR
jgi:hypothetical protein